MTVEERRVGLGVESPSRVAAVHASGLMESGPEENFNHLTRLASRLLGTPLVFLTVVDDVRSFLKGTPDPAAICGPDGTWEAPARSAACQVVVDTGAELVVEDVSQEPRLRDLAQIRELGVAAWAGVPLTDPYGRVLGNLCAFDTRVRPWTDADLEALRGIAAAAAGEVALRLALAESRRHAERAAELAATLRESLVPAQPPRIAGIEIATRFRPGGSGIEVLGDFYDVVPIPGSGAGPASFGVVVGDVCGHGAAAARTTAMARSAVRTAVHSATEPTEVLAIVNEVLKVWFGARWSFATAVYATFHPRADSGWSVAVASAGHPPAMLRRADGRVDQLDGGGRALGISDEARVTTQIVDLRPGDALVLYTDGVTEARDAQGRQLDEPGVANALAGAPADVGVDDLAGLVLLAADTHTGADERDDDAAVVVVGATGSPGRRVLDVAPAAPAPA